jgi:multiple sugar transport system permease protein
MGAMARRLTTRLGNAAFGPRFRENVAGFLFLLPWLLGFLGMVSGPLATSFYLSFTETEPGGNPLWIGLENYERALTDPRMWAAAQVTLTYVVTAVPCVVGVALALALLLNKGLSFLPVYRATFYLPSLIGGSVAIALLWRQVFGADGLLNGALSFLGIDSRISWIGSPSTALGTLVALQSWQFGSAMVIFLAGLRQIPRMYYEAASIDGATRFQQLIYVTLPQVGPLILFNTVMAMIAAFQAFNSAYIISSGSGGPADSTLFFTLYIYQQGFVHFDFGYASALGWMLIAAIAVATLILIQGTRRLVHYGESA